MEKLIIDVRTEEEFEMEHIEGSIVVPLSYIERCSQSVVELIKNKQVLIICRTDRRAKLARDILKKHLPENQLEVYSGGIIEYKKKFSKEIHSHSSRFFIPLMRQVQIVAGSLVFLGVLLGFLVNQNFFYLSGFVGAGLMFAGISGYCGMAHLLKLLPFNK